MPDINFPKEYLTEAMGVVDALNDDKAQLQQYSEERRQLEKSLETLTRTIEREKNETIKSRRADIESNYDKQMRDVDSEITAINGRRQKARAEGVRNRVANNTAALRQEVEQLKVHLKEYVKENKLPGVFKYRLYYTFFSPMSWIDWVVDLCLVAACVAAVIIAYIRHVSLPVFISVVAAIVILVAIYVLIAAKTRDAHHEGMLYCKNILKNIAQKEKTIRVISRNIENDKDDTVYNLGDYDNEIQLQMQKKDAINTQRTEALYQFDNNAANVIIGEIDQKYAGQLGELQQNLSRSTDSVNTFTQRVAAGESRLNNEFVQYVGTRNLSHERIEEMIGLIDSGEATSVHDAASKVK